MQRYWARRRLLGRLVAGVAGAAAVACGGPAPPRAAAPTASPAPAAAAAPPTAVAPTAAPTPTEPPAPTSVAVPTIASAPAGTASVPASSTADRPGSTLRALGGARDRLIGTAVAAAPLRGDQAYRTALAREFDLVVPEVEMKLSVIHPAPASYAFDDADALVAFAGANGMAVRGHTLVWYRRVPGWMEGLRRAELLAALEAHITTVVGRYRGRVFAWDVVNEALDDPTGRPRESIWSRTIGPDYLDHAFRFAHAADPDARLFYNDYGAEGRGAKADAVHAMVRAMLDRNVPIHGVGLQCHFALPSSPSPPPSTAAMVANMARLEALGLDTHVTELDVRIWDGRGSADERLVQQATVYGDVIAAALAAPSCKAVLVWGFSDKYSWIPAATGHPDAATLMDGAFLPKRAYAAVASALAPGPVPGITPAAEKRLLMRSST